MTEPSRRKRRETLSDLQVAKLPRKRKRYVVSDPEQRGMYLRVPVSGPVVYAVVAYDPHGKQTWATLGGADVLSISAARDKARDAIRRIREGLAAFEAPPSQPDSVAAVAENWLKRHVEKNKLRTAPELERVLRVYILPVWADRIFADIRRSDVATLLDGIEDRHGHWVADAALSVLRALASWFATRNDSYVAPFARGMKRTPPQARARSRILSDDEIRRVWKTAETAGSFGAFIQLLLLTGQRRAKLTKLRWDDLDGDVWTIRREAREKGAPAALKLSPPVMAIIRAQPRLASNPYVFPGRTVGPLGGHGDRHKAFRTACDVDGWTLHDARRSCRSLLSRAGVRPDVAERVLGHSVGNAVAQTYDRHSYADEMADALTKLAALINQIVDGEPGGNVVSLHTR